MSIFTDRIKAEPVRFWSVLTGIVTALFGVFTFFGADQELLGLLLVVWAAIGTMFQFFFVRNQVSPVNNG